MAAPVPRRLEPRDIPSALAAWGHAHPEGAACAGDATLDSAQDAWCVEHEGEVAALGVARTWGRVGHVHGLIVAEPFRRRGIGSALLEALLGSLARRDAAVIGVEVDGGGAGALTFLARAGFRPMHLSFVLDRAVKPEPEEAVAAEGGPVPLRMLSGPEHVDELDGIRGIAASVDADFDPTQWLRDRLSRGEAEVALPGSGTPGEGRAFAVLPRRAEGNEALAVSMLVTDDGPPHASLAAMARDLDALARSRGDARVQVAAPSRYWDATRALLDAGFRPRASFLRLTRAGAPERADTRRCCLTTWR